jgi:hypothetical protein
VDKWKKLERKTLMACRLKYIEKISGVFKAINNELTGEIFIFLKSINQKSSFETIQLINQSINQSIPTGLSCQQMTIQSSDKQHF